MHKPSPLGAMMHLKELDRQAAPALLQLRSRRRGASGANAAGAAVMAFLRRLHAVGIPGRVTSRGANAIRDPVMSHRF